MIIKLINYFVTLTNNVISYTYFKRLAKRKKKQLLN